MDYKEQLPMDDPKSVKMLMQIIREIVRDEIKKNANFNCMLPAKVTSVGSGVANIQILGSGDIIPNVPNKTGETLNVNDEIYIEKINASASNIYICLKK